MQKVCQGEGDLCAGGTHVWVRDANRMGKRDYIVECEIVLEESNGQSQLGVTQSS